jgi:hypothetical protein
MIGFLLYLLLDAANIQYGSIILTALGGGGVGSMGTYALINWRMASVEKKIEKIDGMNDRLIRIETKLNRE